MQWRIQAGRQGGPDPLAPHQEFSGKVSQPQNLKKKRKGEGGNGKNVIQKRRLEILPEEKRRKMDKTRGKLAKMLLIFKMWDTFLTCG